MPCGDDQDLPRARVSVASAYVEVVYVVEEEDSDEGTEDAVLYSMGR